MVCQLPQGCRAAPFGSNSGRCWHACCRAVPRATKLFIVLASSAFYAFLFSEWCSPSVLQGRGVVVARGLVGCAGMSPPPRAVVAATAYESYILASRALPAPTPTPPSGPIHDMFAALGCPAPPHPTPFCSAAGVHRGGPRGLWPPAADSLQHPAWQLGRAVHDLDGAVAGGQPGARVHHASYGQGAGAHAAARAACHS